MRELLPIVLSVTLSHPAAAPVKIRELVLRECGFLQAGTVCRTWSSALLRPVIAQSLSLLTREGYLRTKTIHEHTDSPLTLYSAVAFGEGAGGTPRGDRRRQAS